MPVASAPNESLEPSVWRDRCAQRIGQIEPDLPPLEARGLAEELYAFERTRAMAPDAAADFVASEMGRTERTRFERRGAARRADGGAGQRAKATSAG